MANNKSDARLVLLHPQDNVFVCAQSINAGEQICVEGVKKTMQTSVSLGHKIARFDISKESKILKYGTPIGSAILNIAQGEHVHMHNIKSDYIASHTRNKKGAS